MKWEFLGELIELIQATAPRLWEIYERQVYTEAVIGLLQLVLFCLAAVVLFKAGVRSMKAYQDRRNDFASLPSDLIAVLLWFGAFALGLLAVYLAGGVIERFVNPDYYVIQALLDTISMHSMHSMHSMQ